MREGKVPQDFRDGNICPLFKKGKKEAPGNYRPVSLTSVVGKVLESIIKDELTSHLEANNILIPQQHGFRSGKSCTTNLLEYLNQVTEMIDNGEPVDIVFFDYQKAFDLVPHKHLMKKLESCGVLDQRLFYNQKKHEVNWFSIVYHLCHLS